MGIVRTRLAIIAATLLPAAFHLQRFFKLDSAIGELSYPVYIVHFLVVWIVTSSADHWGLAMPASLRAAIIVGVSCVAAHLLNRTVALPVDRVRARIRSSAAPTRSSV